MTSFPFSSKLILNILLSASITYSRLYANTQAHALQTFTFAIRMYHVNTKKKYSHILEKKKILQASYSKTIDCHESNLAQTKISRPVASFSHWKQLPRSVCRPRTFPILSAFPIAKLGYTHICNIPWTIYVSMVKQRIHSRLCTSSSLPFSSWIRSRARGRQRLQVAVVAGYIIHT